MHENTTHVKRTDKLTNERFLYFKSLKTTNACNTTQMNIAHNENKIISSCPYKHPHIYNRNETNKDIGMRNQKELKEIIVITTKD